MTKQELFNKSKVLFLQKETQSAESSFVYNYAEVPHTYDKYHYHKEYELSFHIQNSGTRYVGDSIRRFNSGDLVLVGPNIPHYWHSDDIYYNTQDIYAKLVVIHFVEDFAGKYFLDSPEMSAAKSLLDKAKHGIHIQGDLANEIGLEMINITTEPVGWKRMISFISILNKIGETDNYNLLASVGFCNSFYKSRNEMKLTPIYNYMVENYYKELSLSDVANFANMNVSAFCRYFKGVTNKTFSHILNEIRVGVACRNLINTELSIAEIGFNCGYQNVTYFNRQFKKIKGMTPSEYQMRYKRRG